MTQVFKSLLIIFIGAGSLVLAPLAAWGEDGMPFQGTIAVTATASPNTGNPSAVYCGGAPLMLVAEGHGNGQTSLGPLNFFLQKTLNLPGLMHGCVILTAPNGDELKATYDGTESVPNANGFITATGTLTFTGGTGRFQNASGKGELFCSLHRHLPYDRRRNNIATNRIRFLYIRRACGAPRRRLNRILQKRSQEKELFMKSKNSTTIISAATILAAGVAALAVLLSTGSGPSFGTKRSEWSSSCAEGLQRLRSNRRWALHDRGLQPRRDPGAVKRLLHPSGGNCHGHAG